LRIVCKGTGHAKNQDLEQEVDHFAIAKQLNMLNEVPSKWPDLCHDTIVQRIRKSREAYLKRNEDRAKREDDYYKQKVQAALPKES
jgi:hypothetical protein